MEPLEQRTIAKVTSRLVPFLVLCYFVAYLDRVNVSFAALTMNKDIGLSASAFGFGAGIFFLAYFLFEVPSNLFLERVGARKWIARIMFTWGVISGAMAFVGGETELLHPARAARHRRGRVLPRHHLLPDAVVPGGLPRADHRLLHGGDSALDGDRRAGLGAPAGMDGVAGLKGWQWLFILEATPALIMSVAVFFYLTDRPADATWLEPDERTWLVTRLQQEQRAREAARQYSVKEALLDPKVWALSVVYFGAVATNYGLSFFLPQIVKAFGVTNVQAGLIAALPYVVGVVAIVLWGRRSDRKLERRYHLAFPLLVASAGIALSTALPDPTLKMAALSVAGFGIFGCLPVFWTFPTAFLSGAAAAGGIALINSIGNLAGFAGPYAMGRLKDLPAPTLRAAVAVRRRFHGDDHRPRPRPRSLARARPRSGAGRMKTRRS